VTATSEQGGNETHDDLETSADLKIDQKADTCRCPIWCRGYLANETEIVKGKVKAKRVRASLRCTDWASAHAEVSKFVEVARPQGRGHHDQPVFKLNADDSEACRRHKQGIKRPNDGRAQSDNLEKLIEQTKALTITTEAIRSRISDEVWDRQMPWSYKRDLYIKIIGTISALIGAGASFQHYEEAKKDATEFF
jgi:hypothetical protein